MNVRQRFTFTLIAQSPIHFGGGIPGELLLDGDGAPFVSGNSIGGALRSMLKHSGKVQEEDIRRYLGGEESPSKESKDFVESRIFISDGNITSMDNLSKLISGNDPFPTMEGTAISASTGAARLNHKYKRYYLPPGVKLSFTVECDTQMEGSDRTEEASAPEAELSFTELVYIWAAAIDSGELRFGGQKTNGYGRFTVESLTRYDFVLDSPLALDEFIWNRHSVVEKTCKMEEVWGEIRSSLQSPIILSLKGRFPYGVYQAFPDRIPVGDKASTATVTGIQRDINNHYYLPGSSVKGLLRHELRRLLLRMLQEETGDSGELEAKVDLLVQEWFGSQEKAGSVAVADVVLSEAKEMGIERPDPNKEKDSLKAIYNRIDRITSGVIDGALKTQNEVRGKAEIRLELKATEEVEAKLFPLVYLLRRIGSGLIPLGGRTVIGLGEFKAEATEVNYSGEKLSFQNDSLLTEIERSTLESYYDQFVEYIKTQRGARNDAARI